MALSFTHACLAKALTDFADEFGLTRPDVSSLDEREQAFLDACEALPAALRTNDFSVFDAAMKRFDAADARRAA